MTRPCRLLALPALIALCAAAPARADGMLLGPGDLVEVTAFARPDLSLQRAIDAEGRLLVPPIGRVPAAGLTPEALAEALRGALVASGQMTGDALFVEVARWRDVFVTGDVATPGAYGWRPGLTVRQALALSGGEGRLPPDEFGTYLQATSAVERAGALHVARDGLLARIARLRAELEFIDLRFGGSVPSAEGALNREAFDEGGPAALDPASFAAVVARRVPLILFDLEVPDALRATEELILRDRMALALADDAGNRAELGALDGKLATLETQRNLLEETLSRSNARLEVMLKLGRDGLARAPDVDAAQTSYAQLQASLLDLLSERTDTEIARETQARALAGFASGLRAEAAATLAEAQRSLQETTLRLREADRSAGIARAYLGTDPAPAGKDLPPLVSYELLRDGTGPVEAGADTALSPGDTLVVRVVSE
ncbi:polysaccharide biosynthesis/export family protein [Frigidibacter sp. MR17.14]|uniref:polysaccharide biosynthesis/export family protein n=1 Tax=Frigidibacter sp. MR17.14 TaxID=3126509 RepID=UPI003012F421